MLRNHYYNTPVVYRTHERLPHDGALNMKPSQGTQFSDPGGIQGWVGLVTYRGGILARRWSPIPVL